MTDTEVEQRIIRIDENLKALLKEHESCRNQIHELDKTLAVEVDSGKYAHERITELKKDMIWTVSYLTTIATIIANTVAWALQNVLRYRG